MFSVYTAILSFYHFDCQVLDDNLERKKKGYHFKQKRVAMETKLFPLLK